MTRDAPQHSLTLAFAQRLADWPADDPALLRRCRLLLLDGLAVAVAGAAEPGPRAMAALARENGGGPATLIGQGASAAPANAARVNGMSMHVLDYEPMWNPPNHAISPLLPALLALAERREAAGSSPQGGVLLSCLAKGIEAQGRLRLASGQIEPAKLSLHPPGAVGPLAAALACGSMLGLAPERLAAAVGIAASRSAGLLANVGSMTKALHCGDGAAHGLEAALLAASGFSANEDAIGSPRGWGPSLFPDSFDPAPLTAPVDAPRALDPGPAWKLFPSQFATHFGITAALAARETLGSGPIRRVVLTVPPMPYIDRPQPKDGLDGKFSWQYTAAAALLDGAVGSGSFTDARRFAPDMVALLAAIELRPDPTISGRFDRMHVDITVEPERGDTLTRRCDAPLGSWSRPIGEERIVEKARDLLAPAIGHEAAVELIGRALQADEFEVRSMTAMLRDRHHSSGKDLT
ncbi:MAG: MmgE/PrpD family protein [Acetobacteraceae bacterium]|nr:MmgE/PrpD family protein [Acetobacteraceae bacterium]